MLVMQLQLLISLPRSHAQPTLLNGTVTDPEAAHLTYLPDQDWSNTLVLIFAGSYSQYLASSMYLVPY
jgi:hypothetical protein